MRQDHQHPVDEAIALIEKGHQIAGHHPSDESLHRACRVLEAETSAEDARSELDAKWRDSVQ